MTVACRAKRAGRQGTFGGRDYPVIRAMEPYTSATSRRHLLADEVLQTAALLSDRAAEIQRAAAEAQRRAVLARQKAERARGRPCGGPVECAPSREMRRRRRIGVRGSAENRHML
jgi:hypothetical protein